MPLSKLAEDHLQKTFQIDSHIPAEDAKAALGLYKSQKQVIHTYS